MAVCLYLEHYFVRLSLDGFLFSFGIGMNIYLSCAKVAYFLDLPENYQFWEFLEKNTDFYTYRVFDGVLRYILALVRGIPLVVSLNFLGIPISN